MLGYCTLQTHVPGGIRAVGLPYNPDDGSFVLGAILVNNESEGSAVGRRNPKYLATHKGQQFGGPELNELSFR